MPRLRRFFTLVLITGLVGCQREAAETASLLESYADLPKLRTSHHPQLQAELARLLEEQATPAQLRTKTTPYHRWVAAAANGEEVPESDNLSVILSTAFTPARLSAASRRLEAFFPPQGGYPHDREMFRRADAVRAKYEVSRRRFRQALAASTCDFGIEHDLGLSADTSFLDAMHVGARLEGLLAAKSLRANQLEATLEALRSILLSAERLAAQKHVVPSLGAAHIRTDASMIISEIARHPQATVEVRTALLEQIHQHLDRWSPDSFAWVGERSDGLHVYEMVRGGHLFSLLTEDEIAEMRKRPGGLEAFARAAVAGVDEDEVFYLQSMRRVIEACDQPFYRRREVLESVLQAAEERRGTQREARIADFFLLTSLVEGHRRQGFAQATYQAWSQALSEVLGLPKRKYHTNPLTGEPFDLRRGQTSVVVAGLKQDGADHVIDVPISPAARATRRPQQGGVSSR